jgi:hypothetical protein
MAGNLEYPGRRRPFRRIKPATVLPDFDPHRLLEIGQVVRRHAGRPRHSPKASSEPALQLLQRLFVAGGTSEQVFIRQAGPGIMRRFNLTLLIIHSLDPRPRMQLAAETFPD